MPSSANNPMVWLDRTEIVSGLVFQDQIDVNHVNADDFMMPYNDMIATYRKTHSIENVIADHGISNYRTAIEASNMVMIEDQKRPVDWLDLLQEAASFYKYGEELARMAEQLMMGKAIDGGRLLQFVSELNLGRRVLTPLDEVEPQEDAWVETGYAPIDQYIGGLPKAGLTIVAGGTGIGKTTLALRLGVELVRRYKGVKKPKKLQKKGESEWIEEPGKIAIFSLEMLLSQVVARLLKVEFGLTKDELHRMLGTESAWTVGEIYATAARYAATENLKAIIIDFADMLVEGEQSEAIMGVIYRSLAVLAKTTGVPVILICQLNRTQYQSGIPRINHIRYSGMAEMMSALVLLLYNPSSTVADPQANAILPFLPDKGYIIVGKSRFGFKMGAPGAIQTDFVGATGWGCIGYHYLPVHT